MYQNLKKKTEGFTIIEVLIVLAIAGLIMVIIFIAVPTLQRNGRNNGRQTDANNLVAAVNECVTNRNGVVASCQTLAANAVVAPPADQRNQLTGNPTYGGGGGSLTAATWQFGVTCTPDGTGTQAGTQRQFVVRYQAETNNGQTQRCVSS